MIEKHSSDAKHSYSCLMAGFPSDLQEEILEWSFENVPDDILYTEEEGLGRELDSHCTIKYGLLTEDKEEVFDKVSQEPINFKLGKTFLFDNNPDYDVLVIHIDSGDIIKENKSVSTLENEDSHPEYKAHATIAYLKKGEGKDLVNKQIVDANKNYEFYSLIFSDKSNEKFEKPFMKKASFSKWTKIGEDIFNKLKPLPTIFYESEDGSKKYIPSQEELINPDIMFECMDGGYPIQHFISPELTDSVCSKDGQLASGHTSINCIEPIVLNLIENYGWSMVDAITLAASTCERCLNILLDLSGGEKYSQKEKDSSHTHCEICKVIDPEYDKYYLFGEWKKDMKPAVREIKAPGESIMSVSELKSYTANAKRIFVIKALRRFTSMHKQAGENKNFKIGDEIYYTDPDEPADTMVGEIAEINGDEIITSNEDKISLKDVLSINGKPNPLRKKESRKNPEDVEVDDFVEYISPRDEDDVKEGVVRKIVDRNKVTIDNGDEIGLFDILSILESGDLAFGERNKMKPVEKEYIDVSDIPTMRPQERQIKIDKLLEEYNTASPDKKKQIEQQIKSLKASLNKKKFWIKQAVEREDEGPKMDELGDESNFENVEHYINFIENTLGPDLVESGLEATAEDFYTLVELIKDVDLDEEFVSFLENTLIPDLKDSGTVETAKDFEEGIKFLKEAVKKDQEPVKKNKKKASDKSSWNLDKKNKKIVRDEKQKIKAELLNHGESYAVGQKVVLAGALGSEVTTITQCLGKGKYILAFQNGMTTKANKDIIFPA